MNSKFKSIYYSVLLEFTESTIKKLVEKFKKENSNLSEDNIRTYLNSFEKYKSSPKIVKKDPFTYSWEELENVIDSNFSKANIKTKSDNTDEEKKKLKIYEDSNVIVYKANNQQDCIILGNGYSFCISRPMGGNSYSGYRLRHGSTFYFVRLKNKTAKIQDDKFIEPSHLIVIDAQLNNKFQWTWADNGKQGHGTSDVTKEKIMNSIPELRKAFLENIFVNNSLSDNERTKLLKFQKGDFNSLTYDEKLEYIKAGYDIENINFLTLDKTQRNEYIGMGYSLNDSEFKSLSQQELDRHIKTRTNLLIEQNKMDMNVTYDAYYFAISLYSINMKPAEEILHIIETNSLDSFRVAKYLINNKKTVPESINNSIANESEWSFKYAEFIVDRDDYPNKIKIPEIVINTIANDIEYSYQLSSILIFRKLDVPDKLIDKIIANTKDSLQFAIHIAMIYIKKDTKVPQKLINALPPKVRQDLKLTTNENKKLNNNKDSILLENIYLDILNK